MEKVTQEELTFDNSVKVNSKGDPILGRLTGPCADIINPTRNGRKYSNELWEKVFSNPIVLEYFECGGIPGELDHPEGRQEISSDKICWIMPKPPVKNDKGELIGEWDILDTPNGRILKTLCDYGYKIGVSSRGSGEVYPDADGNEAVDPDQYEFSCFDAVLLPAVKSARLSYVTESLKDSNVTLKQALAESLNSASDSDRKIMQETLNKLNLEYTSEEAQAPSVENIEEVNESVAVENNEADLVEQLQTLLKENKEKEQQIIELQEKLSVSYTKESACNEKILNYQQSISKLSEEAKKVKSLEEKLSKAENDVKQLKEALTTSKKANAANVAKLQANSKSLVESVSSSKHKIRELQEQLKVANENSSGKIDSLNEQLSTAKKDLEIKKTEYSKKLGASNKLVEKYKNIAAGAVDRYIQSQALRLGVSQNEILNRLPESYTFDDIDSVCESLQSVNLNLSRLPFQSMKLQEKLNAKITAPKKEIIPTNQDDIVDESLLSLAKLH